MSDPIDQLCDELMDWELQAKSAEFTRDAIIAAYELRLYALKEEEANDE